MSWKRKDLRRIAELLIAKGADVGIANSEGFGPLHWACKHGLKDLAELLIASGADVNNASLKGTTPLHMASEYGREKMEEIRSEIVTGNCRHLEVVRLLIAKGANVNRADLNGDTPLNVASCYGDKRPGFLDGIAELLIAKGADVSIVNLEGFGPLHLAAKHGQKHLAELLIAGGANIDLLSLKGITPFDLAVKYGNTEIVELLIAKGVNANVANDDNIAQPSLSGGSPGEADEEFDTMSYDQLVEELVRLSREGYSWACVNGFVGMEKYPQYDAVRRIGQIIYRRDGYSGMQRACSTLRQRVILEPGHDGGQYVAEHSWTGIGDWRP
jgi:ankyrin repeat protein